MRASITQKGESYQSHSVYDHQSREGIVENQKLTLMVKFLRRVGLKAVGEILFFRYIEIGF